MCMQIFGFKLRNLCKNLEILIYFHVSEQKCYCWCENVFWGKKDNHACMPEVCIVRCPLFLDYSQHTIRVSASSFWLHQIHLYRGGQWGRQVWTFIKYSKTSLIQCLCNLFSCVIGHWFFIPIWPFSLWFSLCYPTPCLIPTRIRQVLLYISLKDGLFKTQYCNYNRILKKLLQETNYKIIMIA